MLGADIVIELMGGIEPARTLILRAIEGGADVITGNKAATRDQILSAALTEIC